MIKKPRPKYSTKLEDGGEIRLEKIRENFQVRTRGVLDNKWYWVISQLNVDGFCSNQAYFKALIQEIDTRSMFYKGHLYKGHCQNFKKSKGQAIVIPNFLRDKKL